MLPENVLPLATPEYTADEEEELLCRVERKMVGLHTVTSLAKELKVEPYHLRHIIARTEPEIKHRSLGTRQLLQKLAAWVEEEEIINIGADLPTGTLVREACEMADNMQILMILAGHPGIGKTFELMRFEREFPKTNDSPGVIYVRFQKGDTTKRTVLGRILEALYERGLIVSTAGDPMNVVANAFDPDDLLICDEMQFITERDSRSAEVFHTLYDLVTMGMVLVGNMGFEQCFWNSSSFAGLKNRAVCHHPLTTTKSDVRSWAAWAGYEDKALIEMCVKIGARPGDAGGLRTVVTLINIAEQLLKPGEKLTAARLKKAATTLRKLPKGGKA